MIIDIHTLLNLFNKFYLQVVSPGMYFAACVYDACACGQNEQLCVCDAVEAYAAQCTRSGVVVQWRTAHMCREYHKLHHHRLVVFTALPCLHFLID